MPLKDCYVIIKRPFGPPQTPTFSMPLVTDAEWDALATRNNVWRFDIDQKAEEPRIAGVAVGWSYGTADTKLCNWTPQEVAEEAAAVAVVRAELSAEAATETDEDRLAELQAMIADLDSWHFWEDKRNAFGDSANAIYRGCSAPNVPFDIRSNWCLEADRPFTIWLHRAKPAEGQENAFLRVQFGDWRLEFSQERECKLLQVVEMTDAARAALEAQLEAILDTGRLTAADKAQIKAWQDEAATVKADAAKDGRQQPDQWTEAEHAQLSTLDAQIGALKDSKHGNTGAEEVQIEALKGQLYLQQETVNLQETTETLFGVDLPITIIPQRRGYLSIHVGRGANYSTIEVKSIKQRREYDTVIRATPVEISGNGGSLWFKFAYVQVAQSATMLSGWHNAGFPVPGGATFTADWSADTGASATLNVETAGNKFRWQVIIATDGMHLPFVYQVNLEIAATARDTSTEVVVFDSRTWQDMLASYTPKWDGEKRSLGMTVELNCFGLAYQPEDWAHHQVFVYENGLLFSGVIMQAPIKETVMVEGREVEQVTLECADRWALLKQDMLGTQLTGDGKLLGAYMKQVVQSRGFLEAELDIDVGTFRLPTARPGEEPLIRNEWGKHQAEWLDYLFENYGHGMRLGATAAGKIEYKTDLRDVRSDIRFSRDGSGGYETIWDVTRETDWEEFCNDFIIIGGLKPGSKVDRYAARYRDYGSVYDTTARNYCGAWKPMDPRKDDALNTQELCNIACRQAQALYGNPRENITFACRLTNVSREVEPKMICYLEDAQVEVVAVQSSGREENELRLTVKVL